jgi:ABC-2 type transport system permease protein
MTVVRDYRILATWELEAIKPQMSFLIPVQFLLSASLAIGLGFLIPDIDPISAQYLSTGAPTIALLTIGMLVIPQTLSTRKQTGQEDFYKALPIASTVSLAATVTVPVLTSLPGSLLSLVVSAWYFGFTLDPSPLALVAMAFVALVGTSVGAAIGSLSVHPMVTNLITNVLLFFVMLFSPINFPAERLPEWLQTIHQILPIEAMANLVRSTLTGAPTQGSDWLLAGVWAIGGFAISAAIATRRE